ANAGVDRDRSNTAMQVLLLQRERASIAAAGDSLGPMLNRLSSTEDSLTRVTQDVDEAGARLRRIFAPQFEGTRTLAADNIRQIDSVRQVVRSAGSAEDLATLDREAQTASEYAHIADVIEHGLPAAIAGHPAFALRDTVRLRGERTRELIVQTQRAVVAGETAVDEQMQRVVQGDETRGALRSLVTAAAATQEQAAQGLTTAVEHDLGVRGMVLADAARRDAEAAEFGAAAAGFFREVSPDAGGGPGGSGPSSPAAGSGDAPTMDAVIGALERVVQLYPSSPARAGALYQLGELLVRRADERFAEAQRAAAGDTSRAARGEGLTHPDYGAAIGRFEELVQRYPGFPQIDGAAYTLGTLYTAGERYADAASMFERVSAMPDSPLRAES